MGGVDVGGGGGKRSVSADVNLVPFIDLLFVTLAFLLITAVWVTNSRINADAQVPGPPNPDEQLTPQTPEKVLNVHIGTDEFSLVWKQGATVISEVEDEWKQQGQHKDPADTKLDQAILHSDNRLPFKEIVAVLDALYSPKRDMKLGSKTEQVPVFNMTFSVR
jgi:biopolymer transport protein ExbD